MTAFLKRLLCSAWLLLAGLAPLAAQDSQDATAGDSTEVEESDEAYRRRMELEDARQRNLGYTLPPQTYAQKQEKLDKLPEESRDNIRDQLVDIIVENGDWEPSDALKDYPYEPTAAARANPELKQQEQEAWDEQIEKYHKREAAAFGTYVGPVPGPGNPNGGEGGGQEGGESPGSEPGSEQQGAGQQGELEAAQEAATAGTYDPYASSHKPSADEVSTAGVQQSALDFLKGLRGQPPAPGADSTAPSAGEVTSSARTGSGTGLPSPPSPQAAAETGQQETTATDSAQARAEAEAETEDEAAEADESVEIDLTTPGIIAIEDLEKLEGAGGPGQP